MTDDLIDRLAADARPVRAGALQSRIGLALVGGLILSTAALLLWVGLRPDLAGAWADPIFWIKFGYTLLLAIGGFWTVERLARPGGSARRPLVALSIVFAGAALLGIVQMLTAPPASVRTLMLGGTALICPFLIAALSVPFLAATMLAMRRLAPTNLTLAGFAAGLLSGGAGAWVYAFHCGENGLPFLAIWYTLGVLIVGAVGALAGRWLLRW